MRVLPAPIKGCFIIERVIHTDHRGSFTEAFHKRDLEAALGFELNFVQDNVSYSGKDVLRGLHFQQGEYAQAKLLSVLQGSVRDVVVDIRPESPTLGKHFCIDLTDRNQKSLYIPRGMAHGFLSMENNTILSYKCDSYYHEPAEAGILFSDPELGISWGIDQRDVILSDRDKEWPEFKELNL